MVWSFILALAAYKSYSLAKDIDHELAKPVAVEPSRRPLEYVPFRHIFRQGVDHPEVDYKMPYDLLEFSMRYPASDQEKVKLFKEAPENRIMISPSEKDQFLSPRDAYLHDLSILKEKEETVTRDPDDDKPQWFNFEKIHEYNAQNFRPQVMSTTLPNKMLSVADSRRYFSRLSFDIVPHFNEDKLNWTTCKEFGRAVTPKNRFHPRDIVDMNWEPFYVWSLRPNVAFTIHRFSYPTKKVVREYMDRYGRYLGKSLDWTQPKLILKEQLEMLLIAADSSGLLYGIPKQDLPLSIRNLNITLPVVTLRLRIEDPYLALMHCDDFYATILAAPGNCPETDKEKEKEAALLKFRGQGYPITRWRESEELLERKENLGEEEPPKSDAVDEKPYTRLTI